MSQFKTILLITVSMTLFGSSSFAHSNATECARELMTSEGIINMQNRLRSGTIANDAMIKILNFCAGVYKTSAQSPTNEDGSTSYEGLYHNLDCREDSGCAPVNQNESTTVEI